MTRDEALQSLKYEFAGRMASEGDQGMVDLKTLCETGRDASTHAYTWTLNNALRQVQAGAVTMVAVEAVNQHIIR